MSHYRIIPTNKLIFGENKGIIKCNNFFIPIQNDILI